jgi:hypothetical protein
VHRKRSRKTAWLPGWLKHVYVLHWMPFALMAATWFGGYIIHANLKSPLLILYYAGHVFSATAFFGVVMFYLHPGNKDIAPQLRVSSPNTVTKVTHRVFFYILKIQPFAGVLIFLVPDSGFEFGKSGSFWLTHVYNDNFAHMAHAMLFYTIVLLGIFNFLLVLNKRARERREAVRSRP